MLPLGELELAALERGVAADVRHALRELATARAIERHAEVVLDAARRNRLEAAALFRRGLTPALTIADANLREFEAEVESIRSRYGAALALLAIRHATGLDVFGREPR